MVKITKQARMAKICVKATVKDIDNNFFLKVAKMNKFFFALASVAGPGSKNVDIVHGCRGCIG